MTQVKDREGIYKRNILTMSAVRAAECFSNVMTAVFPVSSSPLGSMYLILDGSEKHERSEMEGIRAFHRSWATWGHGHRVPYLKKSCSSASLVEGEEPVT
jgi:hypothetical protein